MPNDPKPPQSNDIEIIETCAALDAITAAPDSEPPSQTQKRLLAQARLLDDLFRMVAERGVTVLNEGRYRDATVEWMTLALRLQKQCVDTARTAAAIDYMQAIMPPKRASAPSPRIGTNELKDQ